MEEIDYIELIGEISSGETKAHARFKSDAGSSGQLSFGQPYLVGSIWKVEIQGTNTTGGSIPLQTIEIDIPQEDVQAANGNPFYWGNVMKYIAKKAKKLLCPTCT